MRAELLSEHLRIVIHLQPMVNFCIKDDEFCITNDEFCIKDDEFCITNDDFCIYPGLGGGVQGPALQSC